jgi:hypothetical protein
VAPGAPELAAGVHSGMTDRTPPREPVRVGLFETPGIQTNVPIWGIDAVEAKVFFFPEATLIYRDERYEGASYESLKVSLSSAASTRRRPSHRTRRSSAAPGALECRWSSTGFWRSRSRAG